MKSKKNCQTHGQYELDVLRLCIADSFLKIETNAVRHGISVEKCHELTVLAIVHALLHGPRAPRDKLGDDHGRISYLAEVFDTPKEGINMIYLLYTETIEANPIAFDAMVKGYVSSLH